MQFLLAPPLDPQTYFSPSGETTLFVDPSNPQGRGPAHYRVQRGTQVLWEGKRPYTLRLAAIADDGTVGGVAYTQGIDSLGEFVIALWDAQGKPRREERLKRTYPRYPDGPHDPRSPGVFLDPANTRFVVRIADPDLNRGEEEWRIFDLLTGKPLPRYQPQRAREANDPAHSLLRVAPVPGTPLCLLHWWRYVPGEPSQLGATFTLIDGSGKRLWRLDLPNDYRVAKDNKAEDRLMDLVREWSALVPSTRPRAFTLHHVASKQAVVYTVSLENGTWLVREESRRPYAFPIPPTVTFSAPQIRPRLLATVTLQAPHGGPLPAIRAIQNPIPAGPGTLAFVRADEPKALLVVRDSGTVAHTVPLSGIPHKESDSFSALLWRGGTRFWLAVEHEKGSDPEKITELYEIDVATKKAQRVPHLQLPRVRSLVPTPTGGFVVLAATHWGSTITESLSAYDRNARLLWTKNNAYGSRDTDGPEVLFSPEAATVLTDGRVAVLDVIRHTVQLYKANGTYQKIVALDKAWKRQAEYPSEIYALPNGGFVVQDYPARPSLYLMSAQGSLTQTIAPQLPSTAPGEPIDVLTDHAGHIWSNNRYSLLRLSPSGKPDRRLGEPPQPDALRQIAHLELGPDGTIYAADARTNAVHRFSAKGAWLGVVKPFVKTPEKEAFALIQRPAFEPGPSGTLGISGRLYASTGKELPRPSGYRTPYERGQSLRRRPDNTWLAPYSTEATAAPDGTLAVVEGTKGQAYLSLYSPTNTPLRVFPIPNAFEYFPFHTDGKTIVFGGPEAIYAYSVSGTPLWTFPVPKGAWTPFLVDGGKTLCLYDGNRTVRRYAL